MQSFSTEVMKSSICSDKTLEIIKDMLLGVVEKGTGKAVHSDIIRIAGKTGTAQIASGGVYRTSGHQVAFCGYFPADEPKYSCIVVIRRPRIGYPSGGTMSGGVVKAIAEKVYASHMSFDVRGYGARFISRDIAGCKERESGGTGKCIDKLDVSANTDSLETKWVVAKREEGEEELHLRVTWQSVKAWCRM